MKTKIEINGYEITVEENEGLITVKAEKEGEIVEEFSLESGKESERKDQDEDIKSFDDFEEEEDFDETEEDEDEEDEYDIDEEEEEDEDEEEEEEDDEEKTLESFQSFINKRKK